MKTQKKVKVVLLGLTNSGKSTIAGILKGKGWAILEADDEAQMKNKGVWPEDEDLLDRLFKEVNKEVLKLDNVVFVTSFLEVEDVKMFHKAGFKIIEVHAPYEELVRRKINRDGEPQDNYERFNRNYKNHQSIIKKVEDLLSLSLDTTNVSSNQLAEKIEQELLKY